MRPRAAIRGASYATVGDEVECPALVPLDLVAGYDHERCPLLMGTRSPSLATLPVDLIAADSTAWHELLARAVLVESPQGQAQKDRTRVLNSGGRPRDFQIDNALTASMHLYSIGIQPEGLGDRTPQCRLHPDELHSAPPDPDTCLLLDGIQILAHSRLGSAVWALFEERFSSLSVSHPVSIEEDRSWFEASIARAGALVAVAFDPQGSVSAAGWLMDDPLAADWLRPTVFQRRDRRPIYFYGLASHRTAPPRAAYSVLKRLGRAVAAANMPVDFIFETTERSSSTCPA